MPKEGCSCHVRTFECQRCDEVVIEAFVEDGHWVFEDGADATCKSCGTINWVSVDVEEGACILSDGEKVEE